MWGRREVRRFSTVMAGIVVLMTLAAAPAGADASTDSARATAVAVCQQRPKAKHVTVTISVDGRSTNHRYPCSKVLATSGSSVPAASDFEVGIDVLKKQCFASAGCSVAYKINAKYDGSTPLDPSKTYTVVYDVAGAESPITANFTIHGSKVDAHKATAYLPNRDANLSATVTSVLEGN
jgi:hypothetical protein